MASLLGHSRLAAMWSRAITQVGQWALDMGNMALHPGLDHPGLVRITQQLGRTKGTGEGRPVQGAPNGPPMDEDPVGPRHWGAGGLVGYKPGTRDRTRELGL